MADRWEPVFWGVALATMVVGNFAALRQNNIKRLLAYSSIAHAGYVMVAVASHSQVGTAAAMFYLASYAFVNVGAFAVVSYVAARGEKHLGVEDFAGLAERQPLAALAMTVFFMSLIGVPLTAGFFGKFYIFKAALDAGMVWLTVLGLLNSAVAAYYYLRVIVMMYTREPSVPVMNLEPASSSLQFGWFAAAAATLVLGIFPSALLEFASRAALLR
jgi:NADH-quinone oxidoreductase subunit N